MDLYHKTVIITGGAGFLGKRIVQELQDQGAKVLIPRKSQVDFTNFDQTKTFINTHPADIIIHSAALYGGLGINERMPAEIYDINTRMLLNLFKASIDENGKPKFEKFVTIGSACAYPSILGTNMSEEKMWDGPVDKSVQNYGEVKKAMETLGHVYRNQYGLKSIHLPLATMYGEGDTFNPDRSHVPAAMIRRFVEAVQSNKTEEELWGVPDTVREFMYVGDAAQGIVKAIKEFDGDPNTEDQSKYTLNIGTGKGTTIDELAKTAAQLAGYQGTISYNGRSPGQKEKALNVQRIQKLLNWTTPTSLQDGLQKTITWYQANKEHADQRF
ncbi:epimerase [Candidatus Pacearchaeota archaeon]|jgi:nucleoside-diphosphate-sugar epimerase|nr:epimerase [Candidatus Pacearchaeota archaeon]